MAKNFSNAGSAKKISEVAKASNEKANVITVKMIGTENLIDYPHNGEDLKDTVDLESSMKQLGFTDPIEVTTYGMEEGKYMIVSGHRRRVAGVKVKIVTFPCIVKTFSSDEEIRNYVLLANSQRDSAKDPLLFCKRYKMHEEYLKESKFKGSVREEIAKRLGISSQQADRYNQFNKIILPVWDMVRDDVVGMSNVLPMATHSVKEQEEILTIFNEFIAKGNKLTRETCDKIIKAYKNGKRTYAEIIEEQSNEVKESNEIKDSGIPLNSSITTNTSESEEKPVNRNNEIRREFDPVQYEDEDPYKEERLTEEDYENIEAVANADKNTNKNKESEKGEKEQKPTLTEDEKQIAHGENISKCISKLEGCFNEIYKFEDVDKAQAVMRTMMQMVAMMNEEINNIAEEYDQQGLIKNQVNIGDVLNNDKVVNYLDQRSEILKNLVKHEKKQPQTSTDYYKYTGAVYEVELITDFIKNGVDINTDLEKQLEHE